jgi:dephospho-CoA kinase
MIREINFIYKGNKGYCTSLVYNLRRSDMLFSYAVVLTGGIATGKSSVVSLFLEDNFFVIDADKIAHRMLDLHKDKIANLFGEEYIVDGSVNRKRLGALIFSTPHEKKRLENLLHPLIFNEIERLAKERDILKKVYIIDIPLFFETKRYPIKNSIVVYTPENLQLERLMRRDGSTKEEAQARIDSQLTIEKKQLLATYIIDNSHSLEELQREYVRVKNQILQDFAKEQPC